MNVQMLPAIVKRAMPNVGVTENYMAARQALAECVRIDEVKKIRSQAEAAATYANQMGDTSLLDLAQKIRVRAERRLGEILIEMIPESRKTVEVNKTQQTTSMRLAKVPEKFFEDQLENVPAKNIPGGKGARLQPTIPGSREIICRHNLSQGKDFTGRPFPPPPTEEEINEQRWQSFAQTIHAWIRDYADDNHKIGGVILGVPDIESAEELIQSIGTLQTHFSETCEKLKLRVKALKILSK